MAEVGPLIRTWRWLMNIGAYPGETDVRAGQRRIVVGYIVFGIPPRLLGGLGRFGVGLGWVGVNDMMAWVVPALGLAALAAKPHWFTAIVHTLLAAALLENLVPTVMLGGIVEADLIMAWT
ncbi:MAG: hypothetical protein KJO17_06600, partial [Acidimicrobiia bacterium]|nr:hypothetical protein [Acidimicrobiia bacterium]